jgi:DnaJ like chaperone protein
MSIIRVLILIFVIAVIFRSVRTIYKVLRSPSDENLENKSSFAGEEDPYEILEINRDAEQSEIRKAYLSKLSQYHPDKVNHLGDDLKKLAAQKTIEIQQAYDQISK